MGDADGKKTEKFAFHTLGIVVPSGLVAISCGVRFDNATDMSQYTLLGAAALLFTVWVVISARKFSMESSGERKAGVRRVMGLIAGVIVVVALWMMMATAGRDETAFAMNITIEIDPEVIGSDPLDTIIPTYAGNFTRVLKGVDPEVEFNVVDDKCLNISLVPSAMDIGVSGDNIVNGLLMIAFIFAALGTVTFTSYGKEDRKQRDDPMANTLFPVQIVVSAAIVGLGIATTVMIFTPFPRFPDEIKLNSTNSAYDHRTEVMYMFGSFVIFVLAHDIVSAIVRARSDAGWSKDATSKFYEVVSYIMAICVIVGSFVMAPQLKADGLEDEFIDQLTEYARAQSDGSADEEIQARLQTYEKAVEFQVPPTVTACTVDNYDDYENYGKVMTLVVPLVIFYVWRSVYAHDYYERAYLEG